MPTASDKHDMPPNLRQKEQMCQMIDPNATDGDAITWQDDRNSYAR